MQYSGWPDAGELVVGDVDEITDFGVFVDLDEYENKRGLCHISEVASGWIKNVRDHVGEGQTVVAKVLEVDEGSQQIDLSIKDVNEHQRKEKIQEWKNQQKADNWMEIAFGDDIDDERYSAVANAILAEFESLYDGFESAAIHGTDALEDVELDDEEIEAIVDTARKNVSVPYVNVTGYVDLRCPRGRRRPRGDRPRSHLRGRPRIPDPGPGTRLQDRRKRARVRCRPRQRVDRRRRRHGRVPPRAERGRRVAIRRFR
jgi:translation initiation factor 2 subunit 1